MSELSVEWIARNLAGKIENKHEVRTGFLTILHMDKNLSNNKQQITFVVKTYKIKAKSQDPNEIILTKANESVKPALTPYISAFVTFGKAEFKFSKKLGSVGGL